MTREKNLRYDQLITRTNLAAQKLQRIVDALANNAVLTKFQTTGIYNEDALISEYEKTMANIDRLMDDAEKLLIDAEILSQR